MHDLLLKHENKT